MRGPVLLAIGAAFLFAAGNNLQRRAAAKVPHQGYGPLRLVLRLLRSPRWLAGGGCAVLGLVLQLAALPAGGVILVQSVIASTLVFSLLLEALAERRRPSPVQLGGAVLVVVGTTVLIRLGQPGTGDALASLWRLAPLCLTVAVVGGGALLRARYRPQGRRTAIVLGAAGGACFAIDAVFLRDLAETAHALDAVRVSADVAGFALTSAVGNLAVQRGFHLAPLRHVLPAMAVAEPFAAFACGWLVFGERLNAGWAGALVVPLGLLLMVAGVLACALGPSAPSCATAGGTATAAAEPATATTPAVTGTEAATEPAVATDAGSAVLAAFTITMAPGPRPAAGSRPPIRRGTRSARRRAWSVPGQSAQGGPSAQGGRTGEGAARPVAGRAAPS